MLPEVRISHAWRIKSLKEIDARSWQLKLYKGYIVLSVAQCHASQKLGGYRIQIKEAQQALAAAHADHMDYEFLQLQLHEYESTAERQQQVKHGCSGVLISAGLSCTREPCGSHGYAGQHPQPLP